MSRPSFTSCGESSSPGRATITRVVTRFAPSPTGYLHIGGVRTALYNWLYARHHKGQFILRIDDTDTERNLAEAVQPILDGLGWLGLDFDQGPFYQSKRGERYREVCDTMLKSGWAYQDGKAVRLSIPHWDDGVGIGCFDLIRRKVSWDDKLIQDPVIRRSDGTFLYNFATVVDDHDMGVTHILRGEEHLSNLPIQLALFRALGWDEPRFAHLSFICAPGSKKKLSKRDLDQFMTADVLAKLKKLGFSEQDVRERNDLNPAVLGYYQKMGFVPAALINYLARLGWALDGSTEIFSVEKLIDCFSLAWVNDSPASFDPGKLLWLNGEYIRRMPMQERVAAVTTYLETL